MANYNKKINETNIRIGEVRFSYSALMNEFETKLERLYELPQTELTITEDVYDPVEWRYEG